MARKGFPHLVLIRLSYKLLYMYIKSCGEWSVLYYSQEDLEDILNPILDDKFWSKENSVQLQCWAQSVHPTPGQLHSVISSRIQVKNEDDKDDWQSLQISFASLARWVELDLGHELKVSSTFLLLYL